MSAFFPRLRGKWPEGSKGASGGGTVRDKAKTVFARALRKQMTVAETVLWSRIRREALGYKFRRQHPIGPYIADFACVEVRLVVEVDGATHRTPEEIDYDAARTAFIEAQGWRVMRVGNLDVTKLTSETLEAIHSALREQQNFMAHKPKSP